MGNGGLWLVEGVRGPHSPREQRGLFVALRNCGEYLGGARQW